MLFGVIDPNNMAYIDLLDATMTGLGPSMENTIEFALSSESPGRANDVEGIRTALILARNARGQGNGSGRFVVEDGAKTVKAFQRLSEVGLFVGICIALVSLIVGAIGIANIMYANVSDRTREIGILAAIGATPGYIRRKFLIESVFISVAGGLVGLLCGGGLYFLISMFVTELGESPIPVSVYVIAIVLSALAGVAAGYAPAQVASRANIIDAIRHV